MRRVTIMRGVSGSGKTYWAQRQRTGATFVSANEYFERDGPYKYVAAQQGAAHQYCMRQFLRALQGTTSDIVVDNTNLWVLEMAPYVALAEAFALEVEIVRMNKQLTSEELAARAVHGVPLEKIQRTLWTVQKERVPGFWPQEHVVMFDL